MSEQHNSGEGFREAHGVGVLGRGRGRSKGWPSTSTHSGRRIPYTARTRVGARKKGVVARRRRKRTR